MTDEVVLSKTITFLRFPLIVTVVFIHIEMTYVVINGNLLVEEREFPIYEWLFHVISKDVTDIAVPLFFFMARFLSSIIQRSQERSICKSWENGYLCVAAQVSDGIYGYNYGKKMKSHKGKYKRKHKIAGCM